MEQYIIRDKRNGRWHWVYDALLADPHITAADKMVYNALATYSNCPEIHPTREQLAERCGNTITVKTISRAIAKLEEVGYISVERGDGRGNASVYELLKAEKGCLKCPSLERGTSETIKGDISDHKGGHQSPPNITSNITSNSEDSISYQFIDEEGNPLQAKTENKPALLLYIKKTEDAFEFTPKLSKVGIILLARFLKEHTLAQWNDYLDFYYYEKESPFYQEKVTPDLKTLLATAFQNQWEQKK